VGEGGAWILDRNKARRSTGKGSVRGSKRTRVGKEHTLLALVGLHREFLSQVRLLPRSGISFSRGCEKCLELGTVEPFSDR
jgi:hypothetical protein